MMRLETGGRVDRALPLTFTFDGESFQGFPGDTLASALLANGVRLVARSFKYHRPRGIFSAGSEEPSALVTIGTGAARSPNMRATMQELFHGLHAESQNRVLSLRHDLMAVNDWLSPFIGAGFYYKTFMWPPAFWERLYEPMIRRAAGIGALSGMQDTAQHERAFAFCDLLVIGAGPAGLMAALAAGHAGADVILADEGPEPGGRLLAEEEEIGGKPAALWAAEVVAELAALPNVRLMPRTTVTGTYDGGIHAALERVSGHLEKPPAGLPETCFWRIAARRSILATGAIERGIAFPDNDRPGVMLAGAVRSYLHRHAVAAGRRVAVFTNNNDGWRTARDLSRRGVETVLIDCRAEAHADAGTARVITGAVVTGTTGRHGLDGITLRRGGGTERLEVDCLAVSGGWNPALHLSCHLGARPVWSEALASFLPAPGAVPGMAAAGVAAGHFSTAGALSSGLAAAAEALEALGRKAPALVAPAAEDAPLSLSPLWQVKDAPGRAFLDLQNDVTTKDIALAAQEAFSAAEHMKRYTTQGMAPDQGKTSNVTALGILADITGRALPDVGTTTTRPPYVPVPIAAMGGDGAGKGFAPHRRAPAEEAHRDAGAPMLEAGLWYRPAYYPRPGETGWRPACDREVRQVREAVGVADVSTLGKIAVQGPDAAAFLDHVYANTISTLAPGRLRYGLMLRPDGHVMDDGTVACLGPGSYLLTTTTQAAIPVMRHLEFVAQVLRPDLDAHPVSVSDHWAQFAVTGPRARRLLQALLPEEIGPDSLPHMGWRPVTVEGVAARLFRVSFSGELGFEIAVPARHGDALFRLLVAQAGTLGGGAYGLEAMNVLRLEKGFLTHAEMDGRTTAFDLGLERMLAKGKDFVGRLGATRPGLSGPERAQLVGLRAPEWGELVAGASLFEPGAQANAANHLGHVTSAGFSPTLGQPIALALLRNGRARIGQRLRLVDHMRRIETECEVCAPCFLDPSGGRARG